MRVGWPASSFAVDENEHERERERRTKRVER
jgi:hypothetical protein